MENVNKTTTKATPAAEKKMTAREIARRYWAGYVIKPATKPEARLQDQAR
jgi:predicted DNA-binding transcriptional regulator